MPGPPCGQVSHPTPTCWPLPWQTFNTFMKADEVPACLNQALVTPTYKQGSSKVETSN